jgi:hypothetical protein
VPAERGELLKERLFDEGILGHTVNPGCRSSQRRLKTSYLFGCLDTYNSYVSDLGV